MTTFDLSKYEIDIVEANGECYVPLQTMNDILLARSYYLTVFNGEKVFVFAYGSEIDDQIYTIEPSKMSEGFAAYNFNELIFLLDNFYGLKPEHDIDSFYSLVTNAGLYEGLSGTDAAAFDEALSKLTSLYLDDLHSGFNVHSCLASAQEEDADEAPSTTGASTTQSTSNTTLYGLARMEYEPDMDIFDEDAKVFQYKEIGDTAIVTFDKFLASKADYYEEADLNNPQDTIELIAAAHKQITRKELAHQKRCARPIQQRRR